ncbi:chitinase C-terminal domain-containing protein [Aeromonas veronii]|nr:chitinase C-terminal domain-containing protein [Aeromonas veronii]
MGDDHQRRIIGYFTSWRNGENGLPTYLVKDIPWDKVTHINYAFAGLNANTIELTIDSSATEQTWEGVPGAEMDPSLPYKGHFNLLNKYKKQYPDVKTLISVGGWAETGGFYSGTTLPNCQVNHAGIEKIADQSVAFIRKYGFDGVDYDYEYPTSMTDAGNPVDWPLSNLCRGNLFPNYVELMRVTREKLDQAGEEDGRKYMLTIASPSSAYLLRGMEAFQITDYLDYVNLMTYDFHGTWNHFAGHNAALFDNKTDAELHHWGQYSAPQFGGIGSLNVAWAGHYFRGAMPAGKINIGVPYYTRGWQNVQGGTYGLNGTAPSSEPCPIGTGMSLPCGDGPKGINNLWFDVDDKGEEIGAGVMPIWHAKNLEHAASLGITTMPSYGPAWGLDPNNPEHVIHGTYDRHFDDKAKVPWLWNAEKKLFLSTEDEESIKHKIDYVNARGYGGLMIWELAGDYGFDQQKNEYYMGDTLTTQMYEGFKNAKPYDIEHNDLPAPDAQLDITLSLGDFDIGDSNFPITPKLTLTNNSTHTIPGGTRVELLMPTSTSDQIADWSGFGVKMVASGGNNNSDGILVSQEKDFHKIGFTLPGWQALNPGASIAVELVYHLPITGLTKGARLILENGTVVGLKSEYPNLPEADLK